MGTILKVKSNGAFISIPAIIGPAGPQGPQGPQGEPGDVSDVLVNGSSVVSSGIARINIVDLVYPIGSIYMSVNSVNPGSILGGTWVAWGTGRVPIGVDTTNTNFNTVEKVGGSASLQAHTHSISFTTGNNSVGHTHSISLTTGNQSAGHTHTYSGTTGGQSANHTHSFTTDSGGAHSHTTQGRANSGSTTPAIFESYTGAGSTRNVNVPRSGTNGTHTHSGTTGNQSADHTHDYSGTTSGISANHTHSWSGNSGGISANHTHSWSGNSGSTGGGNAENLQPYITCYMWKRTA